VVFRACVETSYGEQVGVTGDAVALVRRCPADGLPAWLRWVRSVVTGDLGWACAGHLGGADTVGNRLGGRAGAWCVVGEGAAWRTRVGAKA
jgi:hypothetical protein